MYSIHAFFSFITLAFFLTLPSLYGQVEPEAPAAGASGLDVEGERQAASSIMRIPSPGDFAGEWQRTDGPYTLSIGKYDSENKSVSVKYFNPDPIHVETAKFVRNEYQWVLEILLQDKGYEGSKYQLVYRFDGPTLVGLYTLGATKQQFEVAFVPKKQDEETTKK